MNDVNAPVHQLPAIERDRGRTRLGQRRPIVLVVGMHRSGTSLCSHILSLLGVDMADHIGLEDGTLLPENPKGHWERWEIVDFHDRILGHFNRGYRSQSHDLQLPTGWWADPHVAAIRREMAEFLESRMRTGLFGFKDPRTVRLMPLWYQLCDDLKLTPKLLFCVRNPAQVASSLMARDGLDMTIGERRWLIYVLDFFRYVATDEYCMVQYEKWFDQPNENVLSIEHFLGLARPRFQGELTHAISEVIDPDLRHQRTTLSGLALANTVHRLVVEADGDVGAKDRLKQIARDFTEFQRLSAPYERAFERAVSAEEQLAELKEQLAQANAVRDEHATELEKARCDAATSEARLAEAKQDSAANEAELVDARHRVATNEAERDAFAARGRAAEDALAVTRAEIESTGARLSELEAEHNAMSVRTSVAEEALTQARAEIDTAAARLAEVEAEREATFRRAGAAEDALAVARAEIEAAGARRAELEAEHNAMSVRTSVAEEALTRACAEIDTAAARLAELEVERDAAFRRAGAAEDALAVARAEIEAGDARLTELEAEHNAMSGRTSVAEKALTQARAEIDTAAARLAEVEAEREATFRRAGAAEDALAVACAEIEAAGARRAELETEHNAMSVRTSVAEEALTRACAEIDTAAARLAEVEAEREATFRHASAAEDALAVARAEIEAGDARLTELETEHNAMSVRTSVAEKALAQARAEIDTAAAHLAELEAERDAMSVRASVAEEALAQARAEIDTAAGRLAEVEAERDTVQEALTEAHVEIKSTHLHVAEIEAERETITVRSQALHVQAEAARAAAEDIRRDLDDVRARLSARERELFGLLEANATAEAEREAADAQSQQRISALQAEIAEQAAMLEYITGTVAAAQALANQRQMEFAAVSLEFDAAQAAAVQTQKTTEQLSADLSLATDHLAGLEAIRLELEASNANARRLVEERDGAAEALCRQVASVSDELTAARRVGVAMVAALRNHPTPAPVARLREGWLTLVLRRIGVLPG